MSYNLRVRILTALRLSLRPLVRVLLRHGVTFGQFAEVAKAAFVEEVLSERDSRGRLTNKSRIAVRTGLSRKEVSRICERLLLMAGQANGSASLVQQIGFSARVLQLWHVDPQFSDGNGQPRSLAFAGDDISFSSLVKSVGGDIPPGALRAELLAANAIMELSGGELRPLRRHFIPSESGEDLFVGLTHIVLPVMEGLARNADATEDQPFFQRFAYSDHLATSATSLFRDTASHRSEQFLQSIDDWLSANEARGHGSDEQQRRVGIGVFYYEGEIPRVTDSVPEG